MAFGGILERDLRVGQQEGEQDHEWEQEHKLHIACGYAFTCACSIGRGFLATGLTRWDPTEEHQAQAIKATTAGLWSPPWNEPIAPSPAGPLIGGLQHRLTFDIVNLASQKNAILAESVKHTDAFRISQGPAIQAPQRKQGGRLVVEPSPA